eukprot:TRINITY_DN43328_c0_g2_i1.p1 TRINITY_DN43328_c0_g2~~TRINITY_DN43328_c0_g2_i1.p1  ORF type:complete len:219 (+),score=40.83 TRINITY_DN43328_c0_g2_i1:78-734(+)
MGAACNSHQQGAEDYAYGESFMVSEGTAEDFEARGADMIVSAPCLSVPSKPKAMVQVARACNPPPSAVPKSLMSERTDASVRNVGAEDERSQALEDMIDNLFRLHDLNNDGLLEEAELVQLNMKVAILHYGQDADREAIQRKYSDMFRSEFDARGEPVGFRIFRRYILSVIDEIDSNPLAQEMALEQFNAAAQSARAMFHYDPFASIEDGKILAALSF